jgi:hypothetical protein
VTRDPGRIAGLLYLGVIVFGAFALLDPFHLIVPGDPAATATRVLASETIYRLSIVSGLIGYVLFIYLGRALARLFEGVDRAQSSLMVTLVMMMVVLGLANMVNDLAAIAVLRGTDVLGAFTDAQRQALAMLFLRVGGQGNVVAEVLWGLWLFPFGVLVMRSRFLPRALGVLLILNGVAWIALCLTAVVMPAYTGAVKRWLTVPMLGEIVITLWLLVKGAGARRTVPVAA